MKHFSQGFLVFASSRACPPDIVTNKGWVVEVQSKNHSAIRCLMHTTNDGLLIRSNEITVKQLLEKE
ncbi:MAG: hypothetical protein O2827_04000 [Verrucomicrobia bacterium]|nr:hypothetical protein [Verrucomicrobiota bacterium]